MPKEKIKKVVTDIDVKRKAVKLVIVHLKKKIPEDFIGSDHIAEWVSEMEELLSKPGFIMAEYLEKRKNLSYIIDGLLDEQIRIKLRDSWYSLGKALDKKVKIK